MNQPEQIRQPEAPAKTGLLIVCDTCRASFETGRVVQRPLKNGFIDIRLACPACGTSVHSEYTNSELDKAWKRMNLLRRNALDSEAARKNYQKQAAKFQRKHKKVQVQAGRLFGS